MTLRTTCVSTGQASGLNCSREPISRSRSSGSKYPSRTAGSESSACLASSAALELDRDLAPLASTACSRSPVLAIAGDETGRIERLRERHSSGSNLERDLWVPLGSARRRRRERRDLTLARRRCQQRQMDADILRLD